MKLLVCLVKWTLLTQNDWTEGEPKGFITCQTWITAQNPDFRPKLEKTKAESQVSEAFDW